MPLIKSGSDQAFRANVGNLMGEIEKSPHIQSREQALAIAYATKRRNRAAGGFNPAPWWTRNEARAMTHTGPIASAVPGRTDNHAMKVPAGSYVLPADHVSSLGQGNTQAGMTILNRMFGKQGPYGAGTMPIARGLGAPRPPRAMRVASEAGGAREGEDGGPVPINAAGGEYVITPETVAQIGGGDIKHGHAILDKWVVANRQKHVKTLKTLPGPAKS